MSARGQGRYLQIDTEFLRQRAPPLASALGVSVPTAVGNCTMLWLWMMAHGGRVEGPRAVAIIEGAALWQGKRGEFAAVMLDLGQLRRLPDGALWITGAERYDEIRAKDASRQAAHRSPPVGTPCAPPLWVHPPSATARNDGQSAPLSRVTAPTRDVRRETGDLNPDLSAAKRVSAGKSRSASAAAIRVKPALAARTATPPPAGRESDPPASCAHCGTPEHIPCPARCLHAGEREAAPLPPTTAPPPSGPTTEDEWAEAARQAAPPELTEQWDATRAWVASERFRDESLLALHHAMSSVEAVALEPAAHGEVRAALRFWPGRFHTELTTKEIARLLQVMAAVGGPAQVISLGACPEGLRVEAWAEEQHQARERAADLEVQRAEARLAYRETVRQGIVDGRTFRQAWRLLLAERGLETPEWGGRLRAKLQQLLDDRLYQGSAALFDAVEDFLNYSGFQRWPLEFFLSGGPGDWRVAGFRIDNAAARIARLAVA